MSKAFELFNQTLVIDDDFYLDIQLHNAIKKCAEEAQKDFLERYHKLGDLDRVIKKGTDIAHETLEKAASACVEFLIPFEIYSISSREILQRMNGSYFAEEFEQLEEWYISLLNDEAQKDAYRTARRKNRSKWHSAGFGLNSAMAGAAQAGVLNLASGAAHGAVNLVGKSFSAAGASMSKGSMYKEASNRLASAIYMDVYDYVYILESLIARAGYEIVPLSVADEEKAVGLFTNLKNARLNDSQRYQVAYELFETDPCEKEYFEYCLKVFPEQQKNLLKLAEYCIPDAGDLIDSVLNEIYRSMPHKTEEELLAVHQKLKETQNNLGITKSNLVSDIESTLAKMDLDARTFKNITFETRELKNAAEKEYKSLSDTCHPISKKSKEECLHLREIVERKAHIPEVRDLFLCEVEQQVKSIEYESAKKLHEELLKKYSKNNKQLTKYKMQKIISEILAAITIIIFILAVLAILSGEFKFGLCILGVSILFFIIFGTHSAMFVDKAKEAAKKISPPDLTEAWNQMELCKKEYKDAKKSYQEIANKFGV